MAGSSPPARRPTPHRMLSGLYVARHPHQAVGRVHKQGQPIPAPRHALPSRASGDPSRLHPGGVREDRQGRTAADAPREDAAVATLVVQAAPPPGRQGPLSARAMPPNRRPRRNEPLELGASGEKPGCGWVPSSQTISASEVCGSTRAKHTWRP